jgi:hypothetical protein
MILSLLPPLCLKEFMPLGSIPIARSYGCLRIVDAFNVHIWGGVTVSWHRFVVHEGECGSLLEF